MSIGQTVREIIIANPTASNDEILTAVRAKFPEAKTSNSCIAWYKSDMRKKGLLGGGRSRKVVEPDPVAEAKARLETAGEELEQLSDRNWVKAKVQSLKLEVADLKAFVETEEAKAGKAAEATEETTEDEAAE